MVIKYTSQEVVQFCQNILTTMALYDSQDERFLENSGELLPWVESLGSWGYLYDKPAGQLFSEMMTLMGLSAESLMPSVIKLSEAPLDIGSEASMAANPEVKEEAAGLVALMVLAWRGHMKAIDMFNLSIDELLDKAFSEKGDDEALFKAILADRAVLGSYDVQIRIAEATLVSDETFFDSLSKALTQTKPRRPKLEYDKLRFLIGVLDEHQMLEGFTWNKVADFFIDQLALYPNDSEDPVAGLKKLIISIRDSRGK
ncbi:MAG: hypothetical protein COA46_01855 [Porticoccaceae bacterium]|nr:MAG: hypothetical protein COA46_01855 [Porticoccaceae bacterium]